LTYGGITATNALIENCTFNTQGSFAVLVYPPYDATAEDTISFQLSGCVFNNTNEWTASTGLSYNTNGSALLTGMSEDCQFYGFQSVFAFSTGLWTMNDVTMDGVPVLLRNNLPSAVSLVSFTTWEGNPAPTALTITGSSFENNPYGIYAENIPVWWLMVVTFIISVLELLQTMFHKSVYLMCCSQPFILDLLIPWRGNIVHQCDRHRYF
jgi:hypothetical protein